MTKHRHHDETSEKAFDKIEDNGGEHPDDIDWPIERICISQSGKLITVNAGKEETTVGPELAEKAVVSWVTTLLEFILEEIDYFQS